MSKRTIGIGAAVALVVLGSILLVKWQSQSTDFSYLVPDELMGATLYLDGREIGIASQPHLEFRVTKARHTLEFVKAGRPPTNIEFDLSGQPILRPTVP